jgi:vacuolar-type H+-ATPase subunit H
LTNSVEQVKVAERRAEEVIANARNEASRIIDVAGETAAEIIADGTRASKERAGNSVAAAHQANSVLMERLSVDLEAQIQSLRDGALNKQSEAVEMIYRSLVV